MFKRATGSILVTCLLLLAVANSAPYARGNGQDVPDPSGWNATGTITVDGKTVPGARFLKKGRHVLFPVLALAAALHRQASVDAATRTVAWAGTSFPSPSLLVVEGVAYLSWRDLGRMEPELEYGLSSDRAAFILPPADRRAACPGIPTSQQGASFLCVNALRPGLAVGPLERYVASGRDTILIFCCPSLDNKNGWSAFLRAFAHRRPRTMVRYFEVNRAGVSGYDFDSPLCKELRLKDLPHIRIYSTDGSLLCLGMEQPMHQIFEWARTAGMTEAEFGLFKSSR